MFNPATLATTPAASKLPQLYQLSKVTALSAVLLLILASSVQAANSNHASAFKSQAASCHNNIYNDVKVKNSYSEHQSSRRQTMDCMLTQLRLYQQNSLSSRQQYFAYKAQAWLNYASHEDNIKSQSVAGRQALQAGEIILQALLSGENEHLSLITDIPSTSALMRPDLWATLIALKDSGGITTAPRELAFSEVALIWAAADHCEHASRQRQSASHFRMADRWLEQAREAYINAHNSQTNVALEQLINRYYKQFAPLDPVDNSCHGQVLPLKS